MKIWKKLLTLFLLLTLYGIACPKTAFAKKSIERQVPVLNLCCDAQNSQEIKEDLVLFAQYIPIKYIDAFVDNEWIFIFCDTIQSDIENEIILGATNRDAKTILISSYADYSTFLHEFGHFVDSSTNMIIYRQYIYDFEVNQIAELTKSDYCRTNNRECFAEVFEYVLLNYDNPVSYTEMQQKIPMSLEIIEHGFFNAEGIYDANKINQITHKYFQMYTR